jgi:hypothetical protein
MTKNILDCNDIAFVCPALVLGRFRDDSGNRIRMIRFFWRFLRESEKTPAKCQGIDSGSPRVLNQNRQKNEPFKPKLAEKAHENPNFVCQMIKKHVQKFLQKWLH